MSGAKTWAIVGASRGIGLEFVNQLCARGDPKVIATVRKPTPALAPWQQKDACTLFECDMLSEASIDSFAQQLRDAGIPRLDYLVLNAGVLNYPNRATELSYAEFELHLRTNAIGPIICAQRLLRIGIDIGIVCFISSDSGSAQSFREMEDGFAAYAASKAALNHMLRHMAAELKRKGNGATIIALHPGEVATDMANVELTWDVPDQLSPAESVSKCISVIESKTRHDHGTFWTWENNVSPSEVARRRGTDLFQPMPW